MMLPMLKNKDTVSISKMTGKLLGIDAINTTPSNNKFCLKMAKVKGSICEICYSHRSMKQYKNADRRFNNNGRLLSETTINPDTLGFSSDIVRFSAHGELINYKHLDNLLSIVTSKPSRIFTLWTKRIDIVKRWLRKNKKPKNLILIRSSPILNKVESLPDGFDKVFTNFSKNKDTVSISKMNCGFVPCVTCRKCYTIGDKTTFINEYSK